MRHFKDRGFSFMDLTRTLKEVKEEYILLVLADANYSRVDAARRLKVSLSTVKSMIRSFKAKGINIPPSPKDPHIKYNQKRIHLQKV
jgi:hypothetical protein